MGAGGCSRGCSPGQSLVDRWSVRMCEAEEAAREFPWPGHWLGLWKYEWVRGSFEQPGAVLGFPDPEVHFRPLCAVAGAPGSAAPVTTSVWPMASLLVSLHCTQGPEVART